MRTKVSLMVAFAAVSVLFAAEKVEMRTIAKGAFGGIDRQTGVLVTNQTQWAELWRKHSARQVPAPPAPKVDFETESVLFAALGSKRTGGYAVEITEIREAKQGGKIEAVVSVREPKPGGLTIQALTSPFTIVAVRKLEGPVRFLFERSSGR